MRLRTAVAASLAGALLLVPVAGARADAPSPAPGGDKTRVTFGVQTAAADRVDDRGRFSWVATPGAAVTDHVALLNFSDAPLPLVVYASDGFNTESGDFAVAAAGEAPRDLGSWITLGTTTVTLPPRGTQIVPFTLRVPFGAQPGDHAGGLVVSQPKPTAGTASGSRVAVDQRVALRTYVQVSGDKNARLSIDDVSAAYSGSLLTPWTGSATVSFTLANTGNLRLGAVPDVIVRGPFGIERRAVSVDPIKELLPGNTVRYQVTVPDVPAAVRLTAEVTATPVRPDPPADPLGDAVSAQASFWAVPWLVLIVLVLLAAGLWWWLRRRRRAAPTSKHRASTPVSADLGASA